jgi:nucleotide-binding universal stress UspA family protein
MLSSAVQRLIQFDKIAVLTDLGPDTDKMLRYSAALSRWYGAKLLLVHAATPELPLYVPPEPLPVWPTSDAESRQDAEGKLNAFILKLGLQDLGPKVVVREEGMLPLLNELEQYHPNLLVLATHGREGIKKWLIGSVTEEVFRRVQWPVLVLGPHLDAAHAAQHQLRTVLYATDLSGVSVSALQYAAGIAYDQEAQLMALHVEHDPSQDYTFDQVMAMQKLEDWLHDRIDGLSETLVRVHCLVEFGKAAAIISNTADCNNADLIVLGARGIGAAAIAASHFLGGTAYDVICAAKCPVLIVPRPH